MKFILVINNVLKNNNIKENDFSNDISFSTNESIPIATDYSVVRCCAVLCCVGLGYIVLAWVTV